MAVSACCIASGLASPAMAAPPGDVFTVGNYPVDARAADAVAAKQSAIAAGETAALRTLLKRLVPVTAYPRLRKVPIASADAIVDGISVRSERNSSTEYIASLDFAFRPDAVRKLLERANLPYVETQAQPIVVVPVWLADTQPIPGVDATAWRQAWTGLDTVHALTPVTLDVLKPEVHPDTVAALAKGDTTMMRTFAGAYGGEERLVVAILTPQPQRKLKVTLVGRDMVGSLAWVKSYRFDADDPGYAIELAAIVSLGVLEGRWKAGGARAHAMTREPGSNAQIDGGRDPSVGDLLTTTERDGAAGDTSGNTAAASGDLRLAVQFRDIGEWAALSKRLAAVPGVENIDVAGLSGRSARISLRYAGGVERLAQAVGQQGLSLRPANGGWLLTGAN